ncbi:MAG TPA: DNA gyrase subunit A [Candidatus Azoamicus sp.]
MNGLNEVFIEDELVNSYLSYAMSVIVGRALPDVRDGLKPVHRRILFVMRELNNTFDKNYKKSARIVGDVIGKYHPHGEVAVYDSIVRLTQPFVQRYVLIDGQGNFGSIDGDSPAAMRYTEIKMSEFSDFLLKDLDTSVVDFVDNYDNTEKQPVVLPTMIPNLLINGACGIAVGMATNIPPHNLTEVIDACLLLLSNSSVVIDDLMSFILAPDFPSYGIIFCIDEIKNIYKTGKGKFFLRANTVIESNLSETFIIINELPYQVNKAKLLESFYSLLNSGLLDGVKSIKDESDKDGIRICIYLSKGKNVDVVLSTLFLKTKMQITYNVNMVALVDNIPKLLNLKSILKCFLDHRREIVYRRTKFNLLKSQNKAHLLEGLCIIVCNLDKLINLIVNSNDFSDIKNSFLLVDWDFSGVDFYKKTSITENYKFSSIQIQSILDMKISRLTKLEKNNLFKDYEQVLSNIEYYSKILNDKHVLESVIKDELIFIKNKFGDTRRTKISSNVNNVLLKEIISKEVIIITLSSLGYFKAQLLKNYNVQHRGGRGKVAVGLKDNDDISNALICYTNNILLCFSSFGKVYWFDLSNFALSSRQSKGLPIINLLKMDQSEIINVFLSIKDYNDTDYLFMVTRKGIIKKVLLTDLKKPRSNGIFAIDLSKDDILIDVKIVKDSNNVMLFSKFGRSVRFFVKDIKCSSRNSKGVLGIKLFDSDCVVSLIVFDTDEYYVLAVTENGYGKRIKSDEYNITKRGGRGVIGAKVNKKTGYLVDVECVFINNDLLLITDGGIISRIKVDEISCISRKATGVSLISLSDNEKLVSIKSIDKEFL